MKSINKKLTISLIALIVISTIFATPTLFVQACSNSLTCSANLTTDNTGVNQIAHYKLTINNTGSAKLGQSNFTIPAGYTNLLTSSITVTNTAGQTWASTIVNQPSLTKNGTATLQTSAEGLSTNQSVTLAFTITNPATAKVYQWMINASQNIRDVHDSQIYTTYFNISINAIANAAVLDHITVNPSSFTINVGASQSFTVEAFDNYGNSLGDVTAATMFTSNGATITGNSVSCSIAGSYTVMATYNSKTVTATLTVIAVATPTPTPSPTSSLSPNPIPTATPTPSPNSTPTSTAPPTPAPTATPTPTILPTATPSPTPDQTATPTPTETPTPTPSPAATPTPTPLLTSTAILTFTTTLAAKPTFKITVISAQGSPTASANVTAGASFTASVTNHNGDETHRWISTGYSVDNAAPTSGTSYTFTNVQSPHTITFNWQEQYYLNVTSDCGYTAGTGWYNSGSTAKFTVTQSATDNNGNQVEFLKWNGNGKGAYTGAGTLHSVTVNNPITETATWTIPSTSLYTIGESALILFALLLLALLLVAARKRKKTKNQAQTPIQSKAQ